MYTLNIIITMRMSSFTDNDRKGNSLNSVYFTVIKLTSKTIKPTPLNLLLLLFPSYDLNN